MEIEIIVSEEVAGIMPIDTEGLGSYARDVLAHNNVFIGEVNIVFINDEFMARLNESYKGRPGTTDVLSFNLTGDLSEGLLGEVYVSLERAKAQSGEIGVPFEEEVVRLVTHGLLHLAGHVHDTEEQYDSMMQRTDELVKEFFSGRGVQ